MTEKTVYVVQGRAVDLKNKVAPVSPRGHSLDEVLVELGILNEVTERLRQDRAAENEKNRDTPLTNAILSANHEKCAVIPTAICEACDVRFEDNMLDVAHLVKPGR